ncbi:DUF503 domain-containing protein [Ornithinibacillus californiensis]|uniref:DUF503 domain-containing protein n=1 Tax=Ornithinibacillus californiensis TaxID=161536 RepID=UPI00064DA2CF|nr:DUF503 domain-containing protein [Ornithinibacillus californiensis]
MIFYLEVECILYNAHSLKDKRSVIKRLLARLSQDFNVAVTELDYHDLWQRTKLGIVTITNERSHGDQTMQEILRVIDTYSEIERTISNIEIV